MKSTLINAIPDAATKARLEFSCERSGRANWLVRYELVMPLDEMDIRGTYDNRATKFSVKNIRRRYLSKDNCMRIPLGACNVGTESPDYPFYRDGELNTPFRDSAHAQWDAEKFGGLAIYYNTSRGIYKLEPQPKAP